MVVPKYDDVRSDLTHYIEMEFYGTTCALRYRYSDSTYVFVSRSIFPSYVYFENRIVIKTSHRQHMHVGQVCIEQVKGMTGARSQFLGFRAVKHVFTKLTPSDSRKKENLTLYIQNRCRTLSVQSFCIYQNLSASGLPQGVGQESLHCIRGVRLKRQVQKIHRMGQKIFIKRVRH